MYGLARLSAIVLAMFLMVGNVHANPAVEADAAVAVSEPTAGQPPQQQADQDVPSLDEPVLTPVQMELLHQKIDVTLIDTDRLEQMVDERAGVERVRMSLEDCIGIALEQNPDLQVVRMEPLKSDADIMSARGEFDPLLKHTTSDTHATQGDAGVSQLGSLSSTLGSVLGNSLGGALGSTLGSRLGGLLGGKTDIETSKATSKTGLNGKLPTGTLYEISLETSKQESNLSDILEPWSGSLTLTVSQPLLRGRGLAVNLARIRMAKNMRKSNELQVRLAVMNTVSQVVKSYWDLVGGIENVNVREEALANAQRLLDISQKRFEIGTAAAIEVLQAKAGVAARQSDLISARSSVENAGDVLKQILNLRDSEIFSARRIVPTDRPQVAEFKMEDVAKLDEELQSGIENAIEFRPEILIAQLDIENARLDRTRAANGMLPDISVTGSVSQGGQDKSSSGVFDRIEERDDHSYTIAVQGSVPIGNRVARGAYQRSDLTLRQAEQRLERAKQDVMLKVRLALRSVETSQVLAESNKQTVTLQATNVAAEEKRLRLGVSTSYRVLQVQQDLTIAQTQEVQARIAYEKALVDLGLAEGKLLEQLGIDYQPVDSEPPVSFFRSLAPVAPK